NREAKRLDVYGRKVYSTWGLQLHISNQQAIVSRYTYTTYSAMVKFMDMLPSDFHAKILALVEEGRLISRASLQAALDGADAATRVMATGVAMRRGSWLQVSGLPYEVQKTIQDLPFEGETLSSQKKLTKGLTALKTAEPPSGPSVSIHRQCSRDFSMRSLNGSVIRTAKMAPEREIGVAGEGRVNHLARARDNPSRLQGPNRPFEGACG
ncbi:hypothetical protein UY3_06642, partial [Chelonia mydas]